MDLEKIQPLIEKFGQKLGELANAYGPNVVDLVLWTARVTAIRTLLIGLFATGAAWALWVFFAKQRVRAMDLIEKKRGGGGATDPDGAVFAAIVLFAAASVATLIAGLHLSDAYAWVGLFRPEVILAKKIIGL